MCLAHTLPDYAMNAGEAKKLSIPIYNSANHQIDMTGMAARFAISDPINQDSEPFVIQDCTVVLPDGASCAILSVELAPEDTVNLCGQYIYQVTVKNAEGRPGILKGVLTIAANYDKAAISM